MCLQTIFPILFWQREYFVHGWNWSSLRKFDFHLSQLLSELHQHAEQVEEAKEAYEAAQQAEEEIREAEEVVHQGVIETDKHYGTVKPVCGPPGAAGEEGCIDAWDDKNSDEVG